MYNKVINLLLNKEYIDYYPVVSGVIMAVSFTVPSLWFLGFVGMVPFFAFLYQENLNLKKVFLNGLIFGFIFMGSVLSWFWSTYPLEWAGVGNDYVAFFATFLGWFVASIFFSLFITAWAIIFNRFKKNNLYDIFFASSLWVIFEYLRAFAFSLFLVSSVSLTGPHWTLGFLGYILAENTLVLSLASIGGIYMLSFIIISMNINIYQILFTKITTEAPKKKVVYILSSFVLILIVSFFVHTFSNSVEEHKKLRIAMIDTYISPSFAINKKQYLEHTEKIKRIVVGMKIDEYEPDLIILPENTKFISSLSNIEKKLISKNILQKETLFIDSNPVLVRERGVMSSLVYFNTKKGSSYSYKTLLVPFGEYLPYTTSFFARAFGKQQWVESFNNKRRYSNGKDLNDAVIEFQNIKIGALFCSEIVSNKLYGDITKQGANLLINIASHSVFDGSPTLYSQTTKMAKVHAVQNNRYFIQSMNFAPSFVVNNKGEIIAKSKNTDYGVTYSEVAPNTKVSIYNKFGNWILFISLIIVVVYIRKLLINI